MARFLMFSSRPTSPCSTFAIAFTAVDMDGSNASIFMTPDPKHRGEAGDG